MKRFVVLCLASLLLLSAFCGCESAESETEIRDSQLGRLKPFPINNMTNASIWQDEKGELYLYIEEWDAYRHLQGMSSYKSIHFNENCITVDGEIATISVIDHQGKPSEPTVITYHFNRYEENVELYEVVLNVQANSEEADIYLVNLHNADHGYFFLLPGMNGTSRDWPLITFETTDEGQSWHRIATNYFTLHTSDSPNILKFVSLDVGVISFRYKNIEDACDRTYLTVDGGLSWNQISQLPYPFDLEKTNIWYSEVVDMECVDGRYYLTIKVHGNLVEQEGSGYDFSSNQTSSIQCQFESEDLINWNLK